MNVQSLNVTASAAEQALTEYKSHRNVYDARDWEIERLYRQIAKGKKIISVNDAIRAGGVDDRGRPRLAIMRADQQAVRCNAHGSGSVLFTNETSSRAREWHFDIPWPNRPACREYTLRALLPRIPPRHRPPASNLHKYHVLWEADWTSVPRDPYLLKRIGQDAWIVLAAWDLTDVEVSVLRAHMEKK